MQIPDLVNIIESKKHDGYGLEQNVFAKNTLFVEERAYIDFAIMLNRILVENTFVSRIKTNTFFENIAELDLQMDKDQDYVKDEIIKLTGEKAIETGINQNKLSLVSAYKTNEYEVIEIITNNLV